MSDEQEIRAATERERCIAMIERQPAGLDDWAAQILRGNPRAVSRAISAVENREAQGTELLKRLFPHTGRATLIGVTGATGSGKSTLVDALATALRKESRTVGILAVDPTSPFTGGALLGDRIRMQTHATDPGAYIRSMATRGALGGLAGATLDAAMVLDAAGKEFILVETVGVGQDEVDIARIADVTLLLLVPGMGDDVQAFKAGVMEIADIFVVNKSDLAGADRLEQEIHSTLSLVTAAPGWQPPIVKAIATRAEGVKRLLEAIFRYLDFARDQGALKERRMNYWRARILEILRERVLEQLLPRALANGALNQYAVAVASRQLDPYSAADQILEQAGWDEHAIPRAPNPESRIPVVLDHLGIAVSSLAEAVPFYENALGLTVTGYETIPQEKTNVAMLPLGESRIELLEPTEPDSPIGRFLAKRGAGLHHICLRVPDLEAAVSRLRQSGVKLVNPEPGVGAGGHRYVFVHPSSAGGVLVELVGK